GAGGGGRWGKEPHPKPTPETTPDPTPEPHPDPTPKPPPETPPEPETTPKSSVVPNDTHITPQAVSSEHKHTTTHKKTLPDTGHKDMNSGLIGTLLAGLGALFLFRRNKRTPKDLRK
ncbi:LPXTG cell wall anchor domain-containing protein, partial [Staphylococcus hyicus]